ncbi:MAG TPA: hypothetical protein VFQ05_08445, partial [Candidatus Eisenbacteria bacterium]|nr:hypothetical protein [Candidatus Eisenbacteria bacterium]
MAPHARFRLWATVLAALAILSVSGCSSSPEKRYATAPFGPSAPFDTVIIVPAPMSPEGVVLLLQWCYVSRNEENHRTLFTDDYQFVFGLLDPEGAP